MSKLVWDLQSFLAVLDRENLSYIAQAQKKSISELLSKLQTQETPVVEDAEYMIMSCPSGSPSDGAPGTDGLLYKADSTLSKDPSSVSTPQTRKGSQGPVVPPLPPGGLDEYCYEEAEPFIPETQTPSIDLADSESSHYESYGEEEEDYVKDRAHYIQWSASQPCLRPAPESRICGYLWRKRWLGQWSRHLFLIRNNLLLCYKCAKDLHPQLELNLQGCQVVYKSLHHRKMQYEVKVVAGSHTLVMGFNSCQQAEDWRKVIEEVSGSIYTELETHSSSSLLKSDTIQSSRSSTLLHTDSEEEESQPASLPSSSITLDLKGFLNVLMNCQWQSLQCRVEAGQLKMFGEEGAGGARGAPQYTVQLRGCEVQAGPDTAQSYRITLCQHGDPIVVLEASCSEERERWLQLLQDEVVNQGLHDDSPLDQPDENLSGLKNRRFPDSNMYMTDPFPQLSGTTQPQPIYCNSSILEHMFPSSQNGVSSKDYVTYSNTVFTNHSRKVCEVERGVLKLDLTSARSRTLLRVGSERNLASSEKENKRTFRQSLAFCTERAQGGFLGPLLRRTASAKNSLKRAPSSLFLQHGKVLQRRKEWDTKAPT
ncbi:actin filament-associated protein 1-like 2 [Aplochiton taeniatus]